MLVLDAALLLLVSHLFLAFVFFFALAIHVSYFGVAIGDADLFLEARFFKFEFADTILDHLLLHLFLFENQFFLEFS